MSNNEKYLKEALQRLAEIDAIVKSTYLTDVAKMKELKTLLSMHYDIVDSYEKESNVTSVFGKGRTIVPLPYHEKVELSLYSDVFNSK